jgi:hypothetical protein
MGKHLSSPTTHSYEIPMLGSYTTPITLWLFGDVHRDTQACDVDRWKWFLRKSKEGTDPERTYYLGMGDYHDFASYREGEKIKGIGLHEQTIDAINELVVKRNRAFAQEIKHMRGRLVGLLGGNHTWIQDGVTSDEDLANRMGCEYLGWLSFIRLSFRITITTTIDLYLVACHGLGGGRVLGASVRKVEDLFHIFPMGEIYVMGHDHNRGVWVQPRFKPSVNRDGTFTNKQMRQYFCRSGSFMKSYEPGQSSYASSKLMKPADLGALRLDISFHKDGDRLITDIEALI